jgi:DNA-binding GntR family transcriptional regulator
LCLASHVYRDHVTEIDHDAGTPVWQQLADILRGQIERGDIAPGKLLPSIRTLMQTYGVSDGTVKRAIADLRNAGLVKSVTGRGTYVAERR